MDASARPAVALHSGAGLFAIRRGPWKLIFDAAQKPTQLYDLEHDLHEEKNLLGNEPAVVARLQAELAQIRAAK
jgi:arylsulfatase A-like enzyme